MKGTVMELSEYFKCRSGTGVLSTANAEGKVDAALYARPHFFDEETVAFIARDNLTHENLQTNPSAVYLFKETESNKGKRLYLTKIKEEKDSPLIDEIRRRKNNCHDESRNTEPAFLIVFHIDNVRPLVQVETDVIVPVAAASPKEEYSAGTIRPKLQRKMMEFLHGVRIPPVKKRFSSDGA